MLPRDIIGGQGDVHPALAPGPPKCARAPGDNANSGGKRAFQTSHVTQSLGDKTKQVLRIGCTPGTVQKATSSALIASLASQNPCRPCFQRTWYITGAEPGTRITRAFAGLPFHVTVANCHSDVGIAAVAAAAERARFACGAA